MALLTSGQQVARVACFDKKPLQLARRNPPWDGEKKQKNGDAGEKGYHPPSICRVPGFQTTSLPPPSSIVRSLGLAPNTARILNNNKNQTREFGTATIKGTINIEFPCLPPPRCHDYFGIPNHPTCTKGLSAASPPSR